MIFFVLVMVYLGNSYVPGPKGGPKIMINDYLFMIGRNMILFTCTSVSRNLETGLYIIFKEYSVKVGVLPKVREVVIFLLLIITKLVLEERHATMSDQLTEQ